MGKFAKWVAKQFARIAAYTRYNNTPERKERMREYYIVNKEYLTEYKKQWWLENRDRVNERRRKRK